MDLQWGARASPKANIDEAPGDEVPEPLATHKRWYVTEPLANEHGRTMGCPRCSSGIGTHKAECRGRIEGIVLQQSRMKPKQEEEPRGGRITTKSVPMESEKPTGQATQHAGSSGSPSTGATQAADEKPPEAPDVEMGTEDPCEAKVSSGQRRSWVWKYA